jgi:magnesium-transporting ATPase (P-type)
MGRELNREEKLFLVCTLCLQTSVWVKNVRDNRLLGVKKAEQLLKGVQSKVDDFLKYIYDPEHREEGDISYEFSTKLSDLLERMVQMEDDEIDQIYQIINLEPSEFYRVVQLAKKIIKDRPQHENNNPY